jgi:NAD(P)-dependent dehydrogenase (short-subunit alcohol dehydrogenase family)
MARAAIVTASDSGIGKATAVALARAGFDVGITWHTDEQGATETADEVRSLGRQAEVRQLDLSGDLPAAVVVIDDLAEALGGVYALVNNAGTSESGPALELSYDDWRETLAVDLDGAFLCAQRAARRMVEAGAGGAHRQRDLGARARSADRLRRLRRREARPRRRDQAARARARPARDHRQLGRSR